MSLERWRYKLPLRIRSLVRRRDLESELDEELRYHLDIQTEANMKAGMPEPEARRAARLSLDGIEIRKEECRDMRGLGWLDSCLRDLRHGAVLLKRDARLSLLVILVLGLGIGGNAAIFTLFKAAFLDPLPYEKPHELVTVLDRFHNLGIDDASPTIPEFLDVRERNRVFDDMAFVDHRDFQMTSTDEPVRVFAARATASFFTLLGVKLAHGRTFLPDSQ